MEEHTSPEQMERETRLLFSSLQQHINKVFGEQMPLVDVTVASSSGEQLMAGLSDKQKRDLKCTECDTDAMYFSNVMGIEGLCCEQHGAQVRQENHGRDASSWFCRELMQEKGEDTRWIIVWKLPEEMRDDFGLLIWLWYPIEAEGVEGNSYYNIYREPDDSILLPQGARWEKITREEATHLIGQLIYECQRGHAPYIIGFAPDEPFERPDLNLGYSVAKHSCEECTNERAEPYCFNHKKLAGYGAVHVTWERSHIIEYNPEIKTIRAVVEARTT